VTDSSTAASTPVVLRGPDAARAELAHARSLDPQCLLLPELDRLLGSQADAGVAAAA
jgi:hypothetical protein